jgi:hypothetical protein
MPASPDTSWKLLFAAGYLVPPCRGMDQSQVVSSVLGSPIQVSALPAAFFYPLFSQQAEQAPTLVDFASEGGKQQNTVRDLVRDLAFGDAQVRADASRTLALRLASVTSRRSPEGLFLLLVGKTNAQVRIVLWKFPADQSIQAQLVDSRLTVRIVDDAFSRRSTFFKSAMFEGTSANTSFWKGRVEDRQASLRVREVADYWVYDFLACRPSLTDAHGTRVLANALRETIARTVDIDQRDVLITVAALLRAKSGYQLTLVDFADQFLPDSSRSQFLELAGSEDIWGTPFRIDGDTVADIIRIRSMTLNEHFTVRGPIDEFDDVVSVEPTQEKRVVRVSLEGTITSQSILRR